MTSPFANSDVPFEDELLAAYWAGECEAADVARIEAWCAASPDHADAVGRVATQWAQAVRPVPASGGVDAFVTRMRARVAAESRGAPSITAAPPAMRRPSVTMANAGPARRSGRGVGYGVVVAAGLILAAFLMRGQLSLSRNTAIEPAREYATGDRQQASVTLPDGSQLRLAPNTHARFRITEQGARVVVLTGEALFTVTPDPKRPFRVETATSQTRVLGTTFSVRQYADERIARIAVLEGRIAASNVVADESSATNGAASRAIVLTAGMTATVSDSVAAATTRDVRALMAWAEGRLEFHEVSVAEMLATAGRWYGYEFSLTDSALAKQHVSITLRIDRPDEALATIKAMLGVTATVQGNRVILRPKQTPAATRDVRRQTQDVPPTLDRQFTPSMETGK